MRAITLTRTSPAQHKPANGGRGSAERRASAGGSGRLAAPSGHAQPVLLDLPSRADWLRVLAVAAVRGWRCSKAEGKGC